MCCAREKAFCVDDRELMMFLYRWNDSLMCCLIDNANDKMFFGVPGAKREWPLSLDIRIHAIANANGQCTNKLIARHHPLRSLRSLAIDVDFSVCENPEVILGSSDGQISDESVALPVPGTTQLMYAFLSA